MNQIFQIVADGRHIGITVATDRQTALRQARKAHTRLTASKDDTSCDYKSLDVEPHPAVKLTPFRSGFVSKLLARIHEVSQARFVTETA